MFQIGKPRKDPIDPNISQFSISKVDTQVREDRLKVTDAAPLRQINQAGSMALALPFVYVGRTYTDRLLHVQSKMWCRH